MCFALELIMQCKLSTQWKPERIITLVCTCFRI
uniref:Uncharacterized protein n=1 Tax=Arundo donax TaxID=35708 RepID=A0A0A8ZLM5_ARUDO